MLTTTFTQNLSLYPFEDKNLKIEEYLIRLDQTNLLFKVLYSEYKKSLVWYFEHKDSNSYYGFFMGNKSILRTLISEIRLLKKCIKDFGGVE